MAERSWIFLRGLVRGRGHWADFPERFLKRFPNDKIELLDLPGNGERGDEKSPLAIADYVPLIRERSQALKEGKRVHMLALSLGGMIAVKWMELYPNDFEKMFLVCTSSPDYASFYERFMLKNYGRILPLFGPHSAKDHEKVMLKLLVNNPERASQVFDSLVAYSEKYPVRGGNFARQLLAASGAHFPKKAPGPIKIIGSYGDHLVSPQCTLRIAKAWNLEPHMHPWAGHDIPVDDPAWLIEQLI